MWQEPRELLAAVLEEANALSLYETALLASVFLAECRVVQGLTQDALSLLNAAEIAAGSDAAILAASASLVRSHAPSRQPETPNGRGWRAVKASPRRVAWICNTSSGSC